MNFQEEIKRLGWKERMNPNRNNGWREFVCNGLPIGFYKKSEEDMLADLKALTPNKNDGQKSE